MILNHSHPVVQSPAGCRAPAGCRLFLQTILHIAELKHGGEVLEIAPVSADKPMYLQYILWVSHQPGIFNLYLCMYVIFDFKLCVGTMYTKLRNGARPSAKGCHGDVRTAHGRKMS
jgi:hypothetical protein